MANIITLFAQAVSKALLSSKTEPRQPGLATDDRQIFIKDEDSNEYLFSDDARIRDVLNNYANNVGVASTWGGDADNVHDALQELKSQSNLSGLTADSYVVAQKDVDQIIAPNVTADVSFATIDAIENATFDGTEWEVTETGLYNIASAVWVNLTEPLTSDGTGELLSIISDQRGLIGGYIWAMSQDTATEHPVTFTLAQNFEFTAGEKIKIQFTNGTGATPSIEDAEILAYPSHFSVAKVGNSVNSGGGGVDTIENLGTGEGVLANITGSTLKGKTLVGGSNINLSADGNEITIDSSGTSAGVTNRVYLTGELDTTNVTWFQLSDTDSGSVPSASQSVVNADDQTTEFPEKYISDTYDINGFLTGGDYAMRLSYDVNSLSGEQRIDAFFELVDTDGISNPVTLTTLSTNTINPTTTGLLDAILTGTLPPNIPIVATQRVRVTISATKIGTAGGNVTTTIWTGSDYNSYFNIPVAVTTDGVTDTRTGDVLTNTLDTMDTTIDGKMSKTIANSVSGENIFSGGLKITGTSHSATQYPIGIFKSDGNLADHTGIAPPFFYDVTNLRYNISGDLYMSTLYGNAVNMPSGTGTFNTMNTHGLDATGVTNLVQLNTTGLVNIGLLGGGADITPLALDSGGNVVAGSGGGGGDVYLANNQTFTGDNTFDEPITIADSTNSPLSNQISAFGGVFWFGSGFNIPTTNTSGSSWSRDSTNPAMYGNQQSTGQIIRFTKNGINNQVASVEHDGTITTTTKIALGNYTNPSVANGHIWLDGTITNFGNSIKVAYGSSGANTISRNSPNTAIYSNQNGTGSIEKWTTQSGTNVVAEMDNTGALQLDGGLSVGSIPTGTQVGLVGYDANGHLIQGSGGGTTKRTETIVFRASGSLTNDMRVLKDGALTSVGYPMPFDGVVKCISIVSGTIATGSGGSFDTNIRLVTNGSQPPTTNSGILVGEFVQTLPVTGSTFNRVASTDTPTNTQTISKDDTIICGLKVINVTATDVYITCTIEEI